MTSSPESFSALVVEWKKTVSKLVDAERPVVNPGASSAELLGKIIKAASVFESTVADTKSLAEREEFEGVTPEKLKQRLVEFSGVFGQLRESAAVLAESVDRLKRDFDGILRDSNGGLDPEFDALSLFVDRALAARELAAATSEQVLAYHRGHLLSLSEDDDPRDGVFHFLVLNREKAGELDELASAYVSSWRRWAAASQKADGAHASIEVLAFVFEESGEYRPKTLDAVERGVLSCLESKPPIGEIAAIERELVRFEKVIQAAGRLDRSRAVLQLCRAYTADDPSLSIGLALAGHAGNAQIEGPVTALVLEEGQSLLDQHAATQDYAKAAQLFAQIMASGELPRGGELVRKFREHVFQRAIADASALITAKKFVAARSLIARASELKPSPEQNRVLREKLYTAYMQHAWSLEKKDLPAHTAICEEMVRVFPSDQKALFMLDSSHLEKMRREIGEPGSSFRRVTPKRITELYRLTSKKMRTDRGSATCEAIFDEVQESWRQRLERTDNEVEVFQIVGRIAELVSWDEDQAKEKSAAALRRIVLHASDAEKWGLVERCFALLLERCGDEYVPRTLQNTYLRVLNSLEKSDQSDRLALHLGHFLRLFPRDRALVQAFLERDKSIEGEDAFKDTLRKAPLDNEQVAANAGAVTHSEQLSTSKKAESQLSRSGFQVLLGGSILVVILLGVGAATRKLQSFRWFAFGAVWVGMTIGASLHSLWGLRIF